MQESVKCEVEDALAFGIELCKYKDCLEGQIEAFQGQLMEKVSSITLTTNIPFPRTLAHTHESSLQML